MKTPTDAELMLLCFKQQKLIDQMKVDIKIQKEKEAHGMMNDDLLASLKLNLENCIAKQNEIDCPGLFKYLSGILNMLKTYQKEGILSPASLEALQAFNKKKLFTSEIHADFEKLLSSNNLEFKRLHKHH
jgi:hypothetical protein